MQPRALALAKKYSLCAKTIFQFQNLYISLMTNSLFEFIIQSIRFSWPVNIGVIESFEEVFFLWISLLFDFSKHTHLIIS
jgi:hypothetical protein